MTRLRLPLVGAPPAPEPAPRFTPLSPDVLLAPPGPLVIVAGERAPRGRFAGSLTRALAGAGLRVDVFAEPVEGVTQEALTAALAARAEVADLVVAEGNAALGLYRATLSVLVGVRGASSPAVRALRGRADIEVEQHDDALVAVLAQRLAVRLALRR